MYLNIKQALMMLPSFYPLNYLKINILLLVTSYDTRWVTFLKNILHTIQRRYRQVIVKSQKTIYKTKEVSIASSCLQLKLSKQIQEKIFILITTNYHKADDLYLRLTERIYEPQKAQRDVGNYFSHQYFV